MRDKISVNKTLWGFFDWYVTWEENNCLYIKSGQQRISEESNLYSAAPDGAIEVWNYEDTLIDIPDNVKNIIGDVFVGVVRSTKIDFYDNEGWHHDAQYDVKTHCKLKGTLKQGTPTKDNKIPKE